MTNRPKQIGTATESAVVALLKARGFHTADRIILHGANDHGDVDLVPGTKKWMLEVKGGKAAESASIAQISEWLAETRREKDNGGYENAALVVKRKGFGKDRAYNWYVYMELHDFTRLFHKKTVHPLVTFPISMQLGPFITLVRIYEYGGSAR